MNRLAEGLFSAVDVNVKTQGVKYAGSKLKLLPHILSMIDDIGGINSVFDGFSGTTRVSQALAKNGFRVISNDISVWSKVFATCYLKNKNEIRYYNELIQYLNSLEGYEGWFTQHYGGLDLDGSAIQGDGKKKLWQIHNTMKLDAIRDEIDRLALSETDKAVALTSLMLAMDEVDNSLGHFTSYLKRWSARSYKKMKMKVPMLFENTQDHEVFSEDTTLLTSRIEADLAYFDPPYGSNNEKMPPSRVRYASYYHVWKTICLHDKPDVVGAAARRADCSDTFAPSAFEEYRRDEDGRYKAVIAIEKLIKNTSSRYVALSYSSGGKATAEELNAILKKYGRHIKTIEIDYKKNVMADMKWTNEWLRDADKPNREFIFLIEKC